MTTLEICSNNLCIYCINRECTLNSITLGSRGDCLDFVPIILEKSLLEEQKQKTRNFFEQYKKFI